MGNLELGSKFSLDMSQNGGEGKKIHHIERIFCAFDQKSTFLMKWTKSKATTTATKITTMTIIACSPSF